MFIAVVKDPHFRFGLQAPVGRLQTFQKEIEAKVDQIIATCREYEIKYLILTGDVFDIKAPSMYSFKSISQITKQLKKFKKAGITILAIAGNHDLPMSSVDNKPDSVFYHFTQETDLMVDIGDTLYNADGVVIAGIEYRNSVHQTISTIERVNENIVNFEQEASILVIHEHCVPKGDVANFVEFIKYPDLYKYASNFNVICTGHLHKGYEPHRNKRGQWISNPWNLTRLARNYYAVNDEHKPQMDIISIEDGDIEVVPVYLDVKPYHEAFNEMEMEKAIALEMDITEFEAAISDFEVSGEFNPEDIDISLRDRVQDYLERARNA